ncbi:hypothetical protein QYE76_035941 [Lolium multiflorum]|uniref:Retrotransposon gag domain-containing protein n=1 Tax=Lolium multiflorum TaxID=4521 RepID=A0AAD8R401_LOLMU|nr:hypothetical protein QYE76_035941 [Lolium multiflorum]
MVREKFQSRRHREAKIWGTGVSVPARRRDGEVPPEGFSIDTAAISTAIFITAAPMRGSSSPLRLGAVPVAMWFISLLYKTLLDTTCSGSFTRNKEEFKRDLLDRIKENAEDWENDKGKESGYADKPPFKPLPPKEGNEEKEEKKKKKKKGTKKKKKKKKKKKENKKKEERTQALRQEINYMVAHSLHRHSESLVNTLERVALRVVQEIMERRYSPSGPVLGTHQGEMQLHSRPPLPSDQRSLRDQFGILPKKKIIGYSKPYPNEFDLIPLPPKYRLPDFNKFSGSEGSSSIEHVSRYLAQLGMASASDQLRVRCFSQSLTGPAFGWYTSLQPNSVQSWKQLEELFHTQYHSETTEAGIAELAQVRQKRGETVAEYIQRFRTVKNRCYSVHITEKEAVELAVAGLAASFKDLTFQVEYNSLTHLVNRLTLYEQRHPELYKTSSSARSAWSMPMKMKIPRTIRKLQ